MEFRYLRKIYKHWSLFKGVDYSPAHGLLLQYKDGKDWKDIEIVEEIVDQTT